MFFFLPFTCFSKLLSLWLITEAEDIFLFEYFETSSGIELDPFLVADVACFRAGNIEKGDWVALVVVGGATGISGIPKVFFTPGTLSTVKLEKREQIGIRKKNKRSIAKVHLCFYYAVESGKTSF